ncbi:MAG: hypothetical protein RIA71_13095 [Oceanicaulis sp.]
MAFELSSLGRTCIIFDPSDPENFLFDPSEPHRIEIDGRSFEIACVWWRWKAYIDDEFRRQGMDVGNQNLEWYSALKSIWILNSDRSVDTHRSAIYANEKLVQSHLASQLGARVPNSICTNSKLSIETFIQSSKAIIKPLRVSSTRDENGDYLFLSTAELKREHIDALSSEELNNSVSYIQEFIDKDYEIRVNYLFGNIYARRFSKLRFREVLNKDVVD